MSFPFFLFGLAIVGAIVYYLNPAGEPQQLTAEVSGLVQGYSVPTIQQMIVDACSACGFPYPGVALGIAHEESGFNPNAINVNHDKDGNPTTTDWGVMQVNDSVWQTQGLQPSLDPQTNINVGVGLLCTYWNKYQDLTRTLQAYQAPGHAASGLAPNATEMSLIANWTSYTPPTGLVSA